MANIQMDERTIPVVIAPITAVSTDVGMYVTYIGPYASGKVAVDASTGDITFTSGAVGSEAVDATIDSGDASGGTSDPGVIDVSDSGFTTFGGVVDHINASGTFTARLGSVLRTDLTANTLITLAATQCKSVQLGLLRDSTVILTATLYEIGVRITRANLLNGIKPADAGIMNGLTFLECIGTSAGVNKVQIYSCNELTKVETLIWQSPTLTTNTSYEWNDVDFGAQGAIWSKPGESLLIQRQADTATITSPRIVVQAVQRFLGGSKAGLTAAISDQ